MGSHLQPQHLGDRGKKAKQGFVHIKCRVKVLHWLSDSYSYCYVGVVFHWWILFLFPDCNQLQDIHRQLEYPNRNLAENVSAANMSPYSQKTFHTHSFIFVWFLSSVQCVLRPSPKAPVGVDLHPVCPVAWCLSRLLFYLHHCHPHHHSSTSSEWFPALTESILMSQFVILTPKNSWWYLSDCVVCGLAVSHSLQCESNHGAASEELITPSWPVDESRIYTIAK